MDERVSTAGALCLARIRLAAAGLDEPRREARALVAFLAGCSTAEVATLPGTVLTSALHDALDRRAAREPMAFIAGHREFYGLDFAVAPATLIPRPDSEILVDAALARLSDAPGLVLDLGTGTGCLLLSVLHARPSLRGIGIDRAPAAAALARRNALALGLGPRMLIVAGDWGAAINPGQKFGCILSNPPYIESGALPGLMPDVSRYEPPLALDGGADGLDAYRVIAPLASRHLAAGGIAVVEIGQGQHDRVRGLFEDQGFAVNAVPDLSGILRAVVAQWPGDEKPFGSAPGRR